MTSPRGAVVIVIIAILAFVAYVNSDIGGVAQADEQIGDVIISNRARTDAELQARGVRTSLPVDSSTTYKLGLNGSLN